MPRAGQVRVNGTGVCPDALLAACVRCTCGRLNSLPASPSEARLASAQLPGVPFSCQLSCPVPAAAQVTPKSVRIRKDPFAVTKGGKKGGR